MECLQRKVRDIERAARKPAACGGRVRRWRGPVLSAGSTKFLVSARGLQALSAHSPVWADLVVDHAAAEAHDEAADLVVGTDTLGFLDHDIAAGDPTDHAAKEAAHKPAARLVQPDHAVAD